MRSIQPNKLFCNKLLNTIQQLPPGKNQHAQHQLLLADDNLLKFKLVAKMGKKVVTTATKQLVAEHMLNHRSKEPNYVKKWLIENTVNL